MKEEVIYGLAGMAFVILLFGLVVIIIVSLTKVWQTKIKTVKEELYQKQAAEALEAQKKTASLNEKLVQEIAEVKERLASIEKVLKEVE